MKGDLEKYEKRVAKAVKQFWKQRQAQGKPQGGSDQDKDRGVTTAPSQAASIWMDFGN